MVNTQKKTYRLKKQQGLSTLLFSIAILLLGIIFTVAVSRSSVMEQRMAGNQIRHKQAFEAAQAGMDAAIIHLTAAPQGVDKDSDGNVDVFPTTYGSNLYVAFCQPGSLVTCPDSPGNPVCGTALTATNFNTPLVASCGWSDDNLGRTLIQQGVGTVSAMSMNPNNPLTTKGALNVGGSANVVNYFTNLTVWSGGALTSIGNSGKTFIRNPAVAPPPSGTVPPGPPTSCTTTTDYTCPTDKNNKGPDVIDSDPTLSTLSDTQMFQNYFGKDLATYRSSTSVQDITAAEVNTLAGVRGQSVVIEGNTTLPNSTIGTREQPVILIVNGNLSFQGSPTVYGVVYVTGNVTGGGTPTIQGAMVVQGTMEPTGSVDIIYDPLVTNNAVTKTGRAGWIPGTWRDWTN